MCCVPIVVTFRFKVKFPFELKCLGV